MQERICSTPDHGQDHSNQVSTNRNKKKMNLGLVNYYLIPITYFSSSVSFVPLCEKNSRRPSAPLQRKKMSLGSFFRIVNNSDFCTSRSNDVFNDLLEPLRNFIAVRSFPALTTNAGRHIFDNNNATTHIGGKRRDPFLYRSLTHKTNHGYLLFLKSSVHLSGLGIYAVTSHNSSPFEPHTICSASPAFVCPSTKQLGKG